MIFTETPLRGAWVIAPEPRVDERGSFARAFCMKEFAAHGLNPRIAQVNVSINKSRATLRGMHFQRSPHGESKVVRVTRGAIHDVILDLRPDSPTFRRWYSLELTASQGLALYVPVGFAHGFQTLIDDTEILYLMGSFYEPTAASGVRYDDPAFEIRWPLPPVAMSEADLRFPPFR